MQLVLMTPSTHRTGYRAHRTQITKLRIQWKLRLFRLKNTSDASELVNKFRLEGSGLLDPVSKALETPYLGV